MTTNATNAAAASQHDQSVVTQDIVKVASSAEGASLLEQQSAAAIDKLEQFRAAFLAGHPPDANVNDLSYSECVNAMDDLEEHFAEHLQSVAAAAAAGDVKSANSSVALTAFEDVSSDVINLSRSALQACYLIGASHPTSALFVVKLDSANQQQAQQQKQQPSNQKQSEPGIGKMRHTGLPLLGTAGAAATSPLTKQNVQDLLKKLSTIDSHLTEIKAMPNNQMEKSKMREIIQSITKITTSVCQLAKGFIGTINESGESAVSTLSKRNEINESMRSMQAAVAQTVSFIKPASTTLGSPVSSNPPGVSQRVSMFESNAAGGAGDAAGENRDLQCKNSIENLAEKAKLLIGQLMVASTSSQSNEQVVGNAGGLCAPPCIKLSKEAQQDQTRVFSANKTFVETCIAALKSAASSSSASSAASNGVVVLDEIRGEFDQLKAMLRQFVPGLHKVNALHQECKMMLRQLDSLELSLAVPASSMIIGHNPHHHQNYHQQQQQSSGSSPPDLSQLDQILRLLHTSCQKLPPQPASSSSSSSSTSAAAIRTLWESINANLTEELNSLLEALFDTVSKNARKLRRSQDQHELIALAKTLFQCLVICCEQFASVAPHSAGSSSATTICSPPISPASLVSPTSPPPAAAAAAGGETLFASNQSGAGKKLAQKRGLLLESCSDLQRFTERLARQLGDLNNLYHSIKRALVKYEENHTQLSHQQQNGNQSGNQGGNQEQRASAMANCRKVTQQAQLLSRLAQNYAMKEQHDTSNSTHHGQLVDTFEAVLATCGDLRTMWRQSSQSGQSGSRFEETNNATTTNQQLALANQMDELAKQLTDACLQLLRVRQPEQVLQLNERCVQLMNLVQSSARGAQMCADACSQIHSVLVDLDTLIMFAETSALEPDVILASLSSVGGGSGSITLPSNMSHVREDIVKSSKQLNFSLKFIAKASPTSQEELPKAAFDSVKSFKHLVDSVRIALAVLPSGDASAGGTPDNKASSVAQSSLLHIIRDLTKSYHALLDTIRQIVESGGTNQATEANREKFKSSLSAIISGITGLLEIIKSMENNTERGVHTLKSALTSMKTQFEHLERFNPQDQFNLEQAAPEANKTSIVLDGQSGDGSGNSLRISSDRSVSDVIMSGNLLIQTTSRVMTAVNSLNQSDLEEAANMGRSAAANIVSQICKVSRDQAAAAAANARRLNAMRAEEEERSLLRDDAKSEGSADSSSNSNSRKGSLISNSSLTGAGVALTASKLMGLAGVADDATVLPKPVEGLIEAGKSTVKALIEMFENLHNAATSSADKRETAQSQAKMQVKLCSKRVAQGVNEMTESAKSLQGDNDDLELSKINSTNHTVRAENELREAAQTIESAVKKLSELRPRKSVKRGASFRAAAPQSSQPLSDKAAISAVNEANYQYDGQILGSCKKILCQTGDLIRIAANLQQELVAEGRTAPTQTIQSEHEETQWSQGLISAAKMVAAAIENLCESANGLLHGQLMGSERLISASRNVAERSAQLLLSCQVKARQDSHNWMQLKAAGGQVRKLTEQLVQEANKTFLAQQQQQMTQQQQQQQTSNNVAMNRGMVSQMKSYIEAQAMILAKEKELESLRSNLSSIRNETIISNPDYFDQPPPPPQQ